MVSLLQLQTEKAALENKIIPLIEAGADSVEYANIDFRLREVKKMISQWGTQSNAVYRIM